MFKILSLISLLTGTLADFNMILYNKSPYTQYDTIFTEAVDRWEKIITSNITLEITYYIDEIDGPGNILGSAYWFELNDEILLPTKGEMFFDVADIENNALQGNLDDLILHEMGHVLGIGKSLWKIKGLIYSNCDTTEGNDEYLGTSKFGQILVEDDGGQGTKCSHFDEKIYGDELMTGYLNNKNYLSNITAHALYDLGYSIDFSSDAIDNYEYNNIPSKVINSPVIPIVLFIVGVILFAIVGLFCLYLRKSNKIQPPQRTSSINSDKSIIIV
jgi:hypothetical protein